MKHLGSRHTQRDELRFAARDARMADVLDAVRAMRGVDAPAPSGALAVLLEEGLPPASVANSGQRRVGTVRRMTARVAAVSVPLVAKMSIGLAAASAAVGGAAAADVLPGPVQGWVSDTAAAVGIDLPDSRREPQGFERPGSAGDVPSRGDIAGHARDDSDRLGLERAGDDRSQSRRMLDEDGSGRGNDDDGSSGEDRSGSGERDGDDDRSGSGDDDPERVLRDRRRAAEDAADERQDRAEDAADERQDRAEDTADERQDRAEDAADERRDRAEDAADDAEDAAEDADDEGDDDEPEAGDEDRSGSDDD